MLPRRQVPTRGTSRGDANAKPDCRMSLRRFIQSHICLQDALKERAKVSGQPLETETQTSIASLRKMLCQSSSFESSFPASDDFVKFYDVMFKNAMSLLDQRRLFYQKDGQQTIDKIIGIQKSLPSLNPEDSTDFITAVKKHEKELLDLCDMAASISASVEKDRTEFGCEASSICACWPETCLQLYVASLVESTFQSEGSETLIVELHKQNHFSSARIDYWLIIVLKGTVPRAHTCNDYVGRTFRCCSFSLPCSQEAQITRSLCQHLWVCYWTRKGIVCDTDTETNTASSWCVFLKYFSELVHIDWGTMTWPDSSIHEVQKQQDESRVFWQRWWLTAATRTWRQMPTSMPRSPRCFKQLSVGDKVKIKFEWPWWVQCKSGCGTTDSRESEDSCRDYCIVS